MRIKESGTKVALVKANISLNSQKTFKFFKFK
jgi:hypothetical protein